MVFSEQEKPYSTPLASQFRKPEIQEEFIKTVNNCKQTIKN